jgi:hypothetical protein
MRGFYQTTMNSEKIIEYESQTLIHHLSILTLWFSHQLADQGQLSEAHLNMHNNNYESPLKLVSMVI